MEEKQTNYSPDSVGTKQSWSHLLLVSLVSHFHHKNRGAVKELTKVKMDLDGQQEDANESKVEEGVNHDGCTTCLKVPKLHAAMAPRQLEKQTWRQQHKQNHCHEHRAPIRHPLTHTHTLSLSLSLCVLLEQRKLSWYQKCCNEKW
ncbi:hypothetical protein ACE6H2_002379 [Prunus campanulata]